jgi:hypothetical protein
MFCAVLAVCLCSLDPSPSHERPLAWPEQSERRSRPREVPHENFSPAKAPRMRLWCGSCGCDISCGITEVVSWLASEESTVICSNPCAAHINYLFIKIFFTFELHSLLENKPDSVSYGCPLRAVGDRLELFTSAEHMQSIQEPNPRVSLALQLRKSLTNIMHGVTNGPNGMDAARPLQ